MDKIITEAEQREATYVLGEMAATRLFSLLHERMEELSEKFGIKQSEIARKLGVSEQQVSRWLLQPRNMTVRSAGRLLGAMNAHLVFELEKFEHLTSNNTSVVPDTINVVSKPKITSNDTVTAIPTQIVGRYSQSETAMEICG
jgi:transcriptional regulator with XRE-family HTH domain